MAAGNNIYSSYVPGNHPVMACSITIKISGQCGSQVGEFPGEIADQYDSPVEGYLFRKGEYFL